MRYYSWYVATKNGRPYVSFNKEEMIKTPITEARVNLIEWVIEEIPQKRTLESLHWKVFNLITRLIAL